MLQHFESLCIEIPQPKYAIGTRVEVAGDWGIITGYEFHGLNSHPERFSEGWEYHITFDVDSPNWFTLSGCNWVAEHSLEHAIARNS